MVVVPSRTVRTAENIGEVTARGDTTEVAETGEVEEKTVIVGKLLVVSQILLLLYQPYKLFSSKTI